MGDDEYHQALLAHAHYLGMDDEEDEEFLWLAEEALKADLPPGWEMVMGEGEHEGVPFYYNEELNESIWEHPLDEYYRDKFKRLKAEKRRRAGGERQQQQPPARQGSRERFGWRGEEQQASMGRYDSHDDERRPSRRQARDGYEEEEEEEDDRERRGGGGYRGGRMGSERGRVAEEDSFDDDARIPSKPSRNGEGSDGGGGVAARGGGGSKKQQQEDVEEVEVEDLESLDDEDFGGRPSQQHSPQKGKQQQQQGRPQEEAVMRSTTGSSRRGEEEEGRRGGGGRGGVMMGDSIISDSSARRSGSRGGGDSLAEGRGGSSYYVEYDDFDDDGGRRGGAASPLAGKGRGAGRDLDRERSQYGVAGRRRDEDEEEDDMEGDDDDYDGVRVMRRAQEEEEDEDRGGRWRDVDEGSRRGSGGAGGMPRRRGSDRRDDDDDVRQLYSHLDRPRSRDGDDDDDFDAPASPSNMSSSVRERDRVALGGPDAHTRGSAGTLAGTPTASGVNLAGMSDTVMMMRGGGSSGSSPARSGQQQQQGASRGGGGDGERENGSSLLVQALEEARAQVAEMEGRMRKADEEKRTAVETVKKDMERSHREELERVREQGMHAQEEAIHVQAEAWNKERAELIRMRRNAESEATALEDRVREVEQSHAEVKKALKAEQEEGMRRLKELASQSSSNKVDVEVVERAKAQAAAEAREAAEEMWQKRLNDAMKRAKDREAVLEAQVDAQNARMKEMAEREGSGAAELEEDLSRLREEADQLRSAVEEERQARAQHGRMARDALRDREEEIARLGAVVEELRSQNDRVVQEAIAATAKAEKAAREAQQAQHQKQVSEEHMDALVLEKQAAEAALASVSRELTESKSMVARLRAEAVEVERALGTHKQELKRVQSEHGMTASRERSLEEDMVRVKEECAAKVMAIERKAADLQNANAALQRELLAVQDDGNSRIREVENARDLCEYEKKRAEERAVAAEQWRQKEGARAKQAEQALEACRAELSALREDILNIDEVKAKAERPLKVRIVELERQVEEERRKVEGHDKDVEAIHMRHEAHIQNLKAEVSSKLPVITAAAVRKVEDEWKRRVDDECRLVREAGDREAEGSHLRVVALKSQLLEVQAKLQSQVAAERMTIESLQRSLSRAEEDNRVLRREVEEYRNNSGGGGGGGSGYSYNHHYHGGGLGAGASSYQAAGTPLTPGTLASWEQAMQTSMMTLLQSHLNVMQQQFTPATQMQDVQAGSAYLGGGGDRHHASFPVPFHEPERAFTYDVIPRPPPTSIKPPSHSQAAMGDMSVTTAAVLDEDDRRMRHHHHVGGGRGGGQPFDATHADGLLYADGGGQQESVLGMSVMSDPGTGFYEGYWRAKYLRDTTEGGLMSSSGGGMSRRVGRGGGRKTSVSFLQSLMTTTTTAAAPVRTASTSSSDSTSGVHAT